MIRNRLPSVYDVFISYRRNGGFELALLIHDNLLRRGYQPFMDVEALRSGPFDEELLKRVEQANDVVVVLSAGALDSREGDPACPEDWFVLEIAHAFRAGKNVVPFLTRDFVWPAHIPKEVVRLRHQNGVPPGGAANYFPASLDLLVGLLSPSGQASSRKAPRPVRKAAGGEQFEKLCLLSLNALYPSHPVAFRRRGGSSDPDQGVDIEGSLDGQQVAFQCKSGRVTRDTVRKAAGSLSRYVRPLDRFVLLCYADPTPSARDYVAQQADSFRTAAGPVPAVEIWGPDEMESHFGIDFARRAEKTAAVDAACRRHTRNLEKDWSAEPVWHEPGLTLSRIFVDLDCGLLSWGEIRSAAEKGPGFRIDPFDEHSAPRSPLLDTTVKLIQRDDFRDFIVIQGTPGAGKSTFTLRLSKWLLENGYQPLRVRLRDLGIDSDATREIARNALRMSELDSVVEFCRRPPVLILDGWDELALIGEQRLSERIGSFLLAVRSWMQTTVRRVPVILTGRPSNAATQPGLMNTGTPILTIRSLLPQRLREYLCKLDSVYHESGEGRFRPDLEGVLALYEREWDFARKSGSKKLSGTIDVVGWPLLAHLAYRLLRDCEPERQAALVSDRTLLLRCITEYCCSHSRQPSDQKYGDEVKSRLQPAELRDLVHETAIAITREGREYISLEAFEEAVKEYSGNSKRYLNVARQSEILLVNFLFKSGAEHLGCEFVHKSLREFAFAEALVDLLKRLAVTSEHPGDEDNRQTDDALSVLRRSSEKDIRETEDGLAVARLLSAQWLTADVFEYCSSQMIWEVFRDLEGYEDPAAFRTCKPPLGVDAWCRIRDRMADVWNNWCHMHYFKRGSGTKRFMVDFMGTDQPIADARLGEALFRLTSALHGFVAQYLLRRHLNLKACFWEEQGLVSIGVPHQTSVHQYDERLRLFSPCKFEGEIQLTSLRAVLARINARLADLSGGDFERGREMPDRCDLTFLALMGADLARMSFRFCNLTHANLEESDLTGADLQGAELTNAWLRKANLTRANLAMADLSHSSLAGASLEGACLRDANLNNTDLRGAKGLTIPQLSQSSNWRQARLDPGFRD